MNNAKYLILVFLLAVAGCQSDDNSTKKNSAKRAQAASGFYFPKGDPVGGKVAFTKMQCFHCHAVSGEGFAAPVASPPVPVPLGLSVAQQSREQLAESIIAPSHKVPEGLDNVKGGALSRMGDYGSAMTVRELTDIVAYLKTLDGK